MEEDKQRRILNKLALVWAANDRYDFFPLLAELCGAGTSHYILHTFKDGYTNGVDAKTHSSLCEVDDVDLEAALDALIN